MIDPLRTVSPCLQHMNQSARQRQSDVPYGSKLSMVSSFTGDDSELSELLNGHGKIVGPCQERTLEYDSCVLQFYQVSLLAAVYVTGRYTATRADHFPQDSFVETSMLPRCFLTCARPDIAKTSLAPSFTYNALTPCLL